MMTPLFRVVLVVASVGTLTIVLNKIRKSKLNIEDSIFWILMVLMFVVFAIFPVVPDTMARLLGIYSTANFLFLFMIFILLMRLFNMSMRVSTLEDRIKNLVQEMAIRDKQTADAEIDAQPGAKAGVQVDDQPDVIVPSAESDHIAVAGALHHKGKQHKAPDKSANNGGHNGGC